MGIPIEIMAHLNRSIIKFVAEYNCLAHALIIAISKVDNDPNYDSYRKGSWTLPMIQHLLDTTGIDQTNVAGIPELEKFQEHFRQYKVVVYGGLNCENVMFEGQVELFKRVNLLYDDAIRHYHVVTDLTGTVAKQYICNACNKGCKRDLTHICDQICSDCMFSPPCYFAGTRIICDDCNGHFRIPSCFDNHKKRPGARK
jgi:hypothetical protein